MKRVKARHNTGSGVNAVSLTTDTIYDISVQDIDASFNGVNGLTVSGNLIINGATLSNNGVDGIAYGSGISPRKRTFSIKSMICDSNGGNGATFTGIAGSGPLTMTIRESSFTGNGLNGYVWITDSNGDIWCYLTAVVANNNVGGGFITSGLAEASSDIYVACVANGNGGSGFDQGAGIVRYDGCTALGNTGDGFKVVADSVVMAGCTASGNLGDGCDFSAPTRSVTLLAIKAGAYFNNGGHGITVLDGRLSLSGGAISGNGGNGINASGTQAGISWVEVFGNFGSGISASNSSLYCSNVAVAENLVGGVVGTDLIQIIMDVCTVNNNTGNGVTTSSSLGLLSGPVTLRRCSFTGNTGTGCSIASSIGGQITECSAFNNGVRGIEVLSAGHVMTGNVAAANPAGDVFTAVPGNAVGPAVGASVIGGDNNFANQRP